MSLQKLKLKRIHGLLIHNVDDLFVNNGSKLINALEGLKSQGLVTSIGVSVYTSGQIRRALDIFRPDIIQLPVSLLDQRLIQDGTISYLANRGIEIHARSIFLQGLLLMDINEIPLYFKPWLPLLSEWHQFCKDRLISPLQGAVSFANSVKDISHSIIGVEDWRQLNEILTTSESLSQFEFDRFKCNDEGLLNPSKWIIK